MQSVTHGRTDARTDRPKRICLINFFEVGGIISDKGIQIYSTSFFQEFEKDENFEVILESESSQGAKLGKLKKTIVTIVNDDGKCSYA